MTDRRKAIRERVLALLDANDAGGSGNWRDRDPAYWVGAAEGAYGAEQEAERLRTTLLEIAASQSDARGMRALARAALAFGIVPRKDKP